MHGATMVRRKLSENPEMQGIPHHREKKTRRFGAMAGFLHATDVPGMWFPVSRSI
jgi:hypothetical protein